MPGLAAFAKATAAWHRKSPSKPRRRRVPGIHVFPWSWRRKTWMAGTSPAMTEEFVTTTSPPRLHLCPQPVDDPLRGWIARGDHEQLFQRRLVRADVLVVQNFRIDQILARPVAVGVGQKIRVLRRDFGPVEIVDQLIGLVNIRRIGRDPEIVE